MIKTIFLAILGLQAYFLIGYYILPWLINADFEAWVDNYGPLAILAYLIWPVILVAYILMYVVCWPIFLIEWLKRRKKK